MLIVYFQDIYIVLISFLYSVWTLNKVTEAATETIFENICSFLPGAPFSRLLQKALCVYQTDTNFPGAVFCSSNRFQFPRKPFSARRTDNNFLGRCICSPNRYQFSRSSFFLTIEQIQIFQKAFLFQK